jgi:hypothetical protein
LAGGIALILVVLVIAALIRRHWRKQKANEEIRKLSEAPIPRSTEITMIYELDAVDTMIPAELPGSTDHILHEPGSVSTPGPVSSPETVSTPVTPAPEAGPSTAPAAEERALSEMSFTPGDDSNITISVLH